jgi:ring-1,2-phenylacetyl-CoA epoxidase subunit PaaC
MTTTFITLTETPHIQTLLSLADDALILGHRTSEWTGRAPLLEEELALANIALDLIGQARALYQAAGELIGHSEDELAYLRDPPAFRNALIMELPNGDFAFTIARLFLVSVASDQKWRTGFDDAALSAVAEKAMKETAYHVRHAAEWLIRLGDGTAESHRRAQDAVDTLWPFTGEMTEIRSDARLLWLHAVEPVLKRARLRQPEDGWMQSGGRFGDRSRVAASDDRRTRHTERRADGRRHCRSRNHADLFRLSGDDGDQERDRNGSAGVGSGKGACETRSDTGMDQRLADRQREAEAVGSRDRAA